MFNKWEQIDDEIWAKVICMNGKRRVAKAYARAPVLTVDGSHDGFDGYRIGLNGFENPLLDLKTEEVMRYIGKVGIFLSQKYILFYILTKIYIKCYDSEEQ